MAATVRTVVIVGELVISSTAIRTSLTLTTAGESPVVDLATLESVS